MNKFGSILFQLQKTSSSVFKLTPSTLRYLSTAETPTSTPVNQNEVDKNIEQKQNTSQQTEVESNTQQTELDSAKTGGFAETFSKYAASEESELESQVSFATLLRNSKLMQLGDPEGKVVVGKIFHVVNNDLYIDFGWKFHCVCTKPIKNSNDFVRGAKVRLRIKELELSTKFLGASKDITLMEADCVLLGLMSTPNRIQSTLTPLEQDQQENA